MTLLDEQTKTRDAEPRHAHSGVLDWMKHAGHGLDWFERILDYWRWLGIKRTLALLILIFTPIVKYVWLPAVASSAVASIAESHGLDLVVDGGWTAELFDLRATGRDVRLKASGRYGRPELMKANAVTVDLSVWALFGRYGFIKELTFDEPTVYMERSLAGRWNWEDISDARGLRSVMSIANVRLDGLRIEWVENLPGESGGGLVHSSKATLHIDDVNLLLQDVIVPIDMRPLGTRFTLEGRTADGRLAVQGNANFFRWSRALTSPFQAAATGGGANAAGDANAEEWSPGMRANVYVENVGTAAFGQMGSPNSFVMASGTMTGTIDLIVDTHAVKCSTDLVLTNVEYTPNMSSPFVRQNPQAVFKGLAGLRVNRRVLAACDGNQRDKEWRPLSALQAGITQQALQDAPPVIRRVAALDQERAAGRVTDNNLNSVTGLITDALARQAGKEIGGAVGGEVGGAIAKSLTGSSPEAAPTQNPQSAQDDNAVTRGLKGVGRGIKGIFSKKKKSSGR